MVHSLLPSLDDDCCGCVALLSVLGGTNLPWMFLLVMDSSGLYEASPLGLWWALLRSAGSLCGCGVHFSQGVDVRALLFIPQSAGVWGLSTSKVMGLILLKLNPMSFSSKDLKCENEPVLLTCLSQLEKVILPQPTSLAQEPWYRPTRLLAAAVWLCLKCKFFNGDTTKEACTTFEV